VAAFGIVVTTVATLVIPVAPNWIALGGALFVVGPLDSIVDVAQNAHGLRVRRRYGRSIVNSLHGVWSIGAVLGGLMGAAAAGLRIPTTPNAPQRRRPRRRRRAPRRPTTEAGARSAVPPCGCGLLTVVPGGRRHRRPARVLVNRSQVKVPRQERGWT
jgi:hypothetical protein